MENSVETSALLQYFDADWYKAKYTDVRLSKIDPFTHFMRYGAALDRDPGPDFNTSLYRWHHKLPADVNPLVHFIKTFGAAPQPQAKRTIIDAKRRMWGGDAPGATQELRAIMEDPAQHAFQRSDAALILARKHALESNWASAREALLRIKGFDRRKFYHRRTQILLMECHTQIGDYGLALDMVEAELESGPQGDYVCALMNIYARDTVDPAQDSRLAVLNDFYTHHGYQRIALVDRTKGLVFGNIKHKVPTHPVTDGPLISILMPVYKAGEFLAVAVQSLLCQTWQNIEIIAVDDCSPDDSWAQLQAFAKTDPRLKIHRNAENLGAYGTRNHALSLATGDFITVHDSDDWSHPQMLETQMRHMQDNPDLRVTCSMMTRVLPDMTFLLRPQRENLEFVHRSYPSVLIRRDDLAKLGEWDGVSANADDEFIQRARLLWGDENVVDIEKDVPFSFFLVHENSLTQQAGTSLNSLTFGIRKEYARQAEYWRKQQHAESRSTMTLERTSMKQPFPIPAGLAPKNWVLDHHYDIVIVSDLGLLGGTRRCNEGYIKAARALGLRVGLFHWPRFDLRYVEVADEYVALSYDDGIDILVPEDKITAGLVLIHHPPILGNGIDAFPKIKTDRVAILVNQSPMQRWSQRPVYYTGPQAEQLCEVLFGHKPDWIAISPRTHSVLTQTGGFTTISPDIWYPPLSGVLPDKIPAMPSGLGSGRTPVLGRHARSHWTKWPQDSKRLRAAYCAGSNTVDVRLLGGAEDPLRMLGTLPANWDILPFDSISVADFIKDLDFFAHYVHDDYIEEFGRNVMEAMAAGRVAILPWSFLDIFGDAAAYADPEDVSAVVAQLWADPDAYRQQAQKGFAFVARNCTLNTVKTRLSSLLP